MFSHFHFVANFIGTIEHPIIIPAMTIRVTLNKIAKLIPSSSSPWPVKRQTYTPQAVPELGVST